MGDLDDALGTVSANIAVGSRALEVLEMMARLQEDSLELQRLSTSQGNALVRLQTERIEQAMFQSSYVFLNGCGSTRNVSGTGRRMFAIL